MKKVSTTMKRTTAASNDHNTSDLDQTLMWIGTSRDGFRLSDIIREVGIEIIEGLDDLTKAVNRVAAALERQDG